MNNKIGIIGIGLLILLLFSLLILYFMNNNSINNGLNIYFFNAGKADSALIYNNDVTILIDTGEKELYSDIDKYLKNNNIRSIDYLIITHFDKDHVGSASSIIDNYDIKNVIVSNYPKDSKVYNNYLLSLKNKNMSATVLREDKTYELNNDLKMIINAPKEELYSDDESNNSSLIVKLYYKNNSFLFMGDAKDLRIKEYLESNNESFDLIKVPYHGRELSSLESLISIVKPKYSVITSSLVEKESDSTINILKIYNSNIYLTREGNVLVKSDGTNIDIAQYE
jgi:beta-lactamase superfamily II metal-dependent hydrolase